MIPVPQQVYMGTFLKRIWQAAFLALLAGACCSVCAARGNVGDISCCDIVDGTLTTCDGCVGDSLDINCAEVVEISVGAFSSLSELKSLKLSQLLHLTTPLAPDTFQGLSSLETLAIPDTKLQCFQPGVFRGLSAVTKLDICMSDGESDSSDLTSCPRAGSAGTRAPAADAAEYPLAPGTFEGLTAVSKLTLVGCWVDEVESGAFSGLDSLRQVDFIALKLESSIRPPLRTTLAPGSFAGTAQLRIRRISFYNFFDVKILPGAFSNAVLENLRLQSISRIDLSDNQTFAGLTTAELNFDESKLYDIHPQIFSTVSGVQAVSFARTQFMEAPPPKGALCYMQDVQHVNLSTSAVLFKPDVGLFSYQLLNCSEFNGGPLRKLVTLSMRQRPIDVFEMQILYGMEALQTLDLALTAVAHFYPTAASLNMTLGSLKTIDLQGNFISNWTPSMLAGFPRLEHLDISQVCTSTNFRPTPPYLYMGTHIHSGAFSGSKALGVLKVDCRKFKQLDPGAFEGLTKLQELRFQCSPVPLSGPFHMLPQVLKNGTFRGLSGLSLLQLPPGLLQLDPGVFDGLHSLQTLLVKCGAFRALTTGSLDGLSALQRMEIYSTKLAVGSFRPGVFSNLGQLTHLTLNSLAIANDATDCAANNPGGMCIPPNDRRLASNSGHIFQDPLAGPAKLQLSELSAAAPVAPSLAGTGGGTRGYDKNSDYRLASDAIKSIPPQAQAFDQADSSSPRALQAAGLALGHKFTSGGLKLPDYIFTGLDKLQVLDLSSTGLQALSNNSLQGLQSLEHIDLSFNSILQLQPTLFDDSRSSLQSIRAVGNGLPLHLQPGVFSQLTSFTSLELCTQVPVLQVPTRTVVVVEPGTFAGLTAMKNLSLSSCGLNGPMQAGTFDGLTSLESLDLSLNDILAIESGAFRQLGQLTMLNTSGIGTLRTLPSRAFQGLGAVQSLDLRSLGIETVARSCFEGAHALQRLQLGHNAISHIADGSFLGLSDLDALSLEGNIIRSISPGAFQGLHSLSDLQLRSSPPAKAELVLAGLYAQQFVGLSNLTKLDLSDTGLAFIASGALDGLASIQSIDLSSNSIPALPPGLFDHAATNLRGAQRFSFASNKLTNQGLQAGSFRNLTSLATVDIQDNAKIILCPNAGVLGLSPNTSADDVALGVLASISNLETSACLCSASGTEKISSTATLCVTSRRGSVSNHGHLTPCPAGRFSDTAGAEGLLDAVCLPCGVGTFNPFSGRTSDACIACRSGTYQPDDVAVSVGQCKPCVPGRHAASSRSQICTVCPSGKYATSSGASECPQCPQGTYGRNVTGGAISEASGCVSCPAGSTTVGQGTPSIQGCISSGPIPCPRQNEFRRRNDSQCVPLVCTGSLVIQGGACVGCPSGSCGVPASLGYHTDTSSRPIQVQGCTACSEDQVCPGGTLYPVRTPRSIGSTALAVQAAARLTSSMTGPSKAIPAAGQLTAGITTALLAMLMPIVILLAARYSARFKVTVQAIDMFALSHTIPVGHSLSFVPSTLGGGFTVSLAAVGIALAVWQLVEYFQNNVTVLVDFVPAAGDISGFDEVSADIFFLLAVSIFGSNSASSVSVCPAPSSTLLIEDVAHGLDSLADIGTSGTWRSSLKPPQQTGNGSWLCTYQLSTTQYTLSAVTPITLQAVLPFQAQSATWIVSSSRAYDDSAPGMPKYSTVQGYASATNLAPLASANFSASAFRDILTTETAQGPTRKSGYLLAPVHFTEVHHAPNLTSDGFIPELQPVTITATISVSASGTKARIIPTNSLIGLLSSLGGILGGILALYKGVFPFVEDAVAWCTPKCKSRWRRGKPKADGAMPRLAELHMRERTKRAPAAGTIEHAPTMRNFQAATDTVNPLSSPLLQATNNNTSV